MACPFFEPNETQHPDDAGAMRSPLGQACRGSCRAPGTGGAPQPMKLCNSGYARGRCDRFPSAHDIDANRFAQTPGGVIVFIEETAYAPLRFGPASETPAGSAARRQFEVFQESIAKGYIR